MLGGLFRTLGSSTFWAGLVSLAVQIVAGANGIPIPPALLAAIPAAVGFKEAARRTAEGEQARTSAALEADAREAEAQRAHELELARVKATYSPASDD